MKAQSATGQRLALAPSDHSNVVVTEWRGGDTRPWQDSVAEEWPIALVYNGLSHVVMMASPVELEAFALGFSLTEGILQKPAELYDWHVVQEPNGTRVELTISAQRFAEFKQQRRNMTGRTGCGLCGAESLAQAIRPVRPLPYSTLPDAEAIQAAILQLEQFQPLQNRTGASHGAAWCNNDGAILAAREDVGRHNALDKLIGHWISQGNRFDQGFALISSRASFEMVQKSAAVGIRCLVAVSAPTALAIQH
ncbi:MAG: formate dehydrogenase accessory sulfurtransferase FdhD, partial [Natronospirillum sp.]